MSSVTLLTRVRIHEVSGDHLRSAIVNCVCPECGGALRITRSQFRCQGRCGEDWRPAWDRLRSAEPPARKTRGGSLNRSARAA
jgi:hypothetical protein